MQDDSTPAGKPLSKASAANSYLNRVFNASSSKQDSHSAYTIEEPSKKSVQFKESARGEMEHAVQDQQLASQTQKTSLRTNDGIFKSELKTLARASEEKR